MSDHAPIDLMPCQMCEDRAILHHIGACFYIECASDTCWVSGPLQEAGYLAANSWNRMQGLIAKGVLLEAIEETERGASGTKTGGRL
jgi:hypothetical protein